MDNGLCYIINELYAMTLSKYTKYSRFWLFFVDVEVAHTRLWIYIGYLQCMDVKLSDINNEFNINLFLQKLFIYVLNLTQYRGSQIRHHSQNHGVFRAIFVTDFVNEKHKQNRCFNNLFKHTLVLVRIICNI